MLYNADSNYYIYIFDILDCCIENCREIKYTKTVNDIIDL